jgi:hypothetical protein
MKHEHVDGEGREGTKETTRLPGAIRGICVIRGSLSELDHGWHGFSARPTTVSPSRSGPVAPSQTSRRGVQGSKLKVQSSKFKVEEASQTSRTQSNPVKPSQTIMRKSFIFMMLLDASFMYLCLGSATALVAPKHDVDGLVAAGCVSRPSSEKTIRAEEYWAGRPTRRSSGQNNIRAATQRGLTALPRNGFQSIRVDWHPFTVGLPSSKVQEILMQDVDAKEVSDSSRMCLIPPIVQPAKLSGFTGIKQGDTFGLKE